MMMDSKTDAGVGVVEGEGAVVGERGTIASTIGVSL